jgi:hypothetical protein
MLNEASLGNLETIVVDEESCRDGRSVYHLRSKLGN